MKLASAEPIKPDMVYKDHRIAVSRVGRGWRASIYAPGADRALRESPSSLEECREESIVAQAKGSWTGGVRRARSAPTYQWTIGPNLPTTIRAANPMAAINIAISTAK